MKYYSKLTIATLVATTLAACGGNDGGGTLTISQPVGGRVVSNDGLLDCGATCEHVYESDQDVILTATPEPGYQFLNWSDDCSGPTAQCTLRVEQDRTAGAVFSENTDPGIGSVLEVRAGTVIDLNYTGSTDANDFAGIYTEEANNYQYIERVRLPEDYGSTQIRVPTEAGQYQFRMINNLYETIVIDDDLVVLPYDTAFTLETPPVRPEDEVRISYRGSTHTQDYLVAVPEGMNNYQAASRVRLPGAEGEVILAMPSEEGIYEIRMMNDKYETISPVTRVTLTYDATVQATALTAPGQTIAVTYAGSTQNEDFLGIYGQNKNNYSYESRLRLNHIGQGTVNMAMPQEPGIYSIRLVNSNYVTIASFEFVSVLNDDQVALYAAPDLNSVGQTMVAAYSGATGNETIGLYAQGAADDSPLVSYDVQGLPSGNLNITLPDEQGFYELRMLSGATVLDSIRYIKVLDLQQTHVEVPQESIAGETWQVIFSAMPDEADFVAIYPAGDWNPYAPITRVSINDANGMLNLRMPTQAGDYVVRVMDSNYTVLVEGNGFLVDPYVANAVMSVSSAQPRDIIEIQYSGSTDSNDYVGFYEPGGSNYEHLERVRLIDTEGTVQLRVPSYEGVFELRMINSNYETILNESTLNVAYGVTSVQGPQFALPGEVISVDFSGSTQDDDFVALFPQYSNNYGYLDRATLRNQGSGTVELETAQQTGFLPVRMVNGGYITIDRSSPVAVLDPAKTELFIDPGFGAVGGSVELAYSQPLALENATVGLYEQGADNDSPVSELPVESYPLGRVTMIAPLNDGIYDVRYVDAADQTLATAGRFYAIDAGQRNIFVPGQVRAGETLWVGYSGSVEESNNYAALYADGESNNYQYVGRVKLDGTEGVVSLRMPTVAGTYTVRMIDSNYITLKQGTRFDVLPYAATASYPSIAQPTDVVTVSYSGSTDANDFVGVFPPGATNYQHSARARLPEEAGEVSLQLPNSLGSYEVRLINSQYETIVELGTITLSYENNITVTSADLAVPGELLTVSYVGSTDSDDAIALFPQHVNNYQWVDRQRTYGVAEGEVQLELPQQTGIYDIRMFNQGYVTMSNNVTVSVLDSAVTELFIAPEIVAPGAVFTAAYSGSSASTNLVGIYNQFNGAQMNSIALPIGFGNTALQAPAVAGVYEVEMRNGSDQTLATTERLYVLNPNEQAVHGPVKVRAGDTVRFIYSGVESANPRIAFYSLADSDYYARSVQLADNSGALNVRVPTIGGDYLVRIIDSQQNILVEGYQIEIEPYDGDIEPQ